MGAGLHVRQCIARLLFVWGSGEKKRSKQKNSFGYMLCMYTYTYHVSYIIYHMSYIYKSKKSGEQTKHEVGM